MTSKLLQLEQSKKQRDPGSGIALQGWVSLNRISNLRPVFVVRSLLFHVSKSSLSPGFEPDPVHETHPLPVPVGKKTLLLSIVFFKKMRQNIKLWASHTLRYNYIVVIYIMSLVSPGIMR